MLITVMSERELHVPRLGRVVADPGFRLVAAMNPFDAVGTARISSAVYDRVCRLSVDYQSADEEAAIVARAVDGADAGMGASGSSSSSAGPASHPDLRVGSSVRGALDATAVVRSLADAARAAASTTPSVGLDAVLVALSGRVRLREGSPADVARRSSPSCGPRSSASPARPDRRAAARREKPRPRRGRPLPEGGPAGGRGDRRRQALDRRPGGRCRGGRASTRCRRRSAQLDEAAFDDAMAEDADEAMALLADMTRATDAGLRELARRLAGRLVLDVARRGPARPRGSGPHRRRPVPARRRRPRHRRQHRGDRRSPGGPGRRRSRAAPRPAVGPAAHRGVPARRPQRVDGRQAAGDERRRRGGGGVPVAGRLQRGVVRQGLGGRQVAGRAGRRRDRRRRRAGAARSRHDRPRRRARRGRPAAGPVERRAQDHDPAVGLPGRPSRATWSSPRPRWTSWRSSPPTATPTPPRSWPPPSARRSPPSPARPTAADALTRVLA